MLFDDDPTYRRLVTKFAQKNKIGLVVCKNFEELQCKLVEEKPDIVILDYELENSVTGPEIARSLGNVPVLLISGKENWTHERDSWSSNIKGFFHKKYGIPGLFEKVEDLSSWQRAVA